MPPSVVGKLPKSFPASEVVPCCQMETKKRANVSQVEQEDGGDHCHVKNSPLSEIGGSRGARESSKMLEISDIEFSWILLMIYYLFIMSIVYSLLERYEEFTVGWKREMWIKGV